MAHHQRSNSRQERTSLLEPIYTNGHLEPILEKDVESIDEIERPRSPFHPQNVATAFANAKRSFPIVPRRIPPVRSLLASFLYALIPSFIQSRIHPPLRQEKIHPTAYLDGIRGVAAFAVFLCHLSYQCFTITIGFGQGEPGENAYLIQMPFVKLLYSGPPAVSIFFVISGYALSFKPVRQMRARQFDGLLTTLGSSVLRRPFRLFLPCFISTFMVFVMVRLGVYEYTRPVAESAEFLKHVHEDHPGRATEFMVQFWDWALKSFDFIHCFNFFIYAGSSDYDRHLWTIPVEFRASMILFLQHFAVARMKSWIRLSSLVGLSYFFLKWDRWEICLFNFGCILAELDQIRNEKLAASTPALEAARPPTRRDKYWHWFIWSNFWAGLYLMSYPDDFGSTTPGFIYLHSWIPPYFMQSYRFWQSVGAIMVLYSINNVDSLKALFAGPVIQYLGKISYALYLMHGPVIHSFGYTIMPFWWGLTGVEPRFNYELGFLFNAICITIFLIWASDLFWRFVDIPCVSFAKWVESRIIVTQHASLGDG